MCPRKKELPVLSVRYSVIAAQVGNQTTMYMKIIIQGAFSLLSFERIMVLSWYDQMFRLANPCHEWGV